MKLTIDDPKFLKDSVNIISEMINEVRLKVDKNKIELIAMDPANVAMVIFRLLASAFVEYDVKTNQDIAISLDSLKQILRRAKPDDKITLELEAENKLKIQLTGNAVRTFHLPLIEIEKKEQKVPNLTFPVKIETKSTILDEAIEDTAVVAESVAFIMEPDKFVIKSEGNLSSAMVELTNSEENKITNPTNQLVLAKYSLDYLKKMIKGSKLSENVVIEFNKDYPLRINYDVVDKLSLSFILAPRISTD